MSDSARSNLKNWKQQLIKRLFFRWETSAMDSRK